MQSKFIKFSSIATFIISFLIMAYFSLYELILSSVVFLIIIILINLTILSSRLRLSNLVFYSYAVFIGVLLITLHINQFDSVFDSFGDDERFYNWAIQSKSNFFQNSYSFYEKLLAIVLFIFNIMGFKDSPLLLYPLNWLVLSLTITMSYRLTFLITGRYIKFSLLFVALALNYTFIQNSVHLYRDIFIAFFSLSSLIFLLERKTLTAYIMSIPIALFRLPSGIINIFILNIAMYFKKRKSTFALGTIVTFSLLSLSILSLNLNINIGKYSSSTIIQYASDRNVSYKEEISNQSGGVSFIKSLPLPIEMIAHIPGQTIRPIKIASMYKPYRERYSHLNIFNHRSFGGAITSLSLIFLIGFYIRGIILMFFIKKYEVKVFMLYFIVTSITIGMLSMQDRTRIPLISLFPILLALNFMPYTISSLGKKILYPFNKVVLSMLIAIPIGLSIIN